MFISYGREHEMNPLYSMKMAILRVIADAQGSNVHKINLIGRSYDRGLLEHALNVTFTSEQRAVADRAFDELKDNGLICPTYSDLSTPELWVIITEEGRQALTRGTLDDLDRALREINPNLINIRAGAWNAVSSGQSDAVRQAAHSGRELIDQTLKEGAPDEDVKSDPEFSIDSTSKSGITRRHRLKYLMRRFHGEVSETELATVEKAIDFVLALDKKLQAASHARGEPSREDVADALEAAEIALCQVLGATRAR